MTRLPKEIEHAMSVLYEHFHRTGQRRYWDVDTEEHFALFKKYEHLDYFELVRWEGKRRILLSGSGIEYARKLTPPPVLPAQAVDSPPPPGMSIKPPMTPARLLDALRIELQHAELAKEERAALSARIETLWADPTYHRLLRGALEEG